MNIEIEKELCMQRIALIIAVNKQLSSELREIGYPNEYPEKFKDLEKAYEALKNALLGEDIDGVFTLGEATIEEVKALEDLKQLY